MRRDKEWAAWSKGLVLVPAGIALLSGILDVHGHITQQDERQAQGPLPSIPPPIVPTNRVYFLLHPLPQTCYITHKNSQIDG